MSTDETAAPAAPPWKIIVGGMDKRASCHCWPAWSAYWKPLGCPSGPPPSLPSDLTSSGGLAGENADPIITQCPFARAFWMRTGWNPDMIAACARTVDLHSPARCTQGPKEALLLCFWELWKHSDVVFRSQGTEVIREAFQQGRYSDTLSTKGSSTSLVGFPTSEWEAKVCTGEGLYWTREDACSECQFLIRTMNRGNWTLGQVGSKTRDVSK